MSKSDREDIKREIQIMQHLRGQPNIFDRIIAKGHYSERAAASICRQIVNVVHICHFMGVMHRDLKPENFLLSSKDENALIKATDFGLSVFIEEGTIFSISLQASFKYLLECVPKFHQLIVSRKSVSQYSWECLLCCSRSSAAQVWEGNRYMECRSNIVYPALC